MPYIPDLKRRKYLKETLDPINGGELNFTLYYLSLKYLDRVGKSYGSSEDVLHAYEEALHSVYLPISRPIKEKTPMNIGQLTDLFQNVVCNYVARTNKSHRPTLRASQLEFYRRIVGPYEDEKIEENGDVTIEKDSGKGHLKDPIY